MGTTINTNAPGTAVNESQAISEELAQVKARLACLTQKISVCAQLLEGKRCVTFADLIEHGLLPDNSGSLPTMET